MYVKDLKLTVIQGAIVKKKQAKNHQTKI